MELEELAHKFGVKNIIVSHINNDYWKDSISVVVSDNLAFNLVGKTVTFVPLTKEGIGKEVSRKAYVSVLNAVRVELREESF